MLDKSMNRDLLVDGRPLTLEIQPPSPVVERGRVQGFTCEATIQAPGDDAIQITSGGVDEIQAIMMCLAAAGERISSLGEQVTWLGLNTSGLPRITRSESGDELFITMAMPLPDEEILA